MDKKEYTEEMVRLIIEGAIQEEREACASLCFQMWNEWMDNKFISNRPDAEDCANAIRARG